MKSKSTKLTDNKNRGCTDTNLFYNNFGYKDIFEDLDFEMPFVERTNSCEDMTWLSGVKNTRHYPYKMICKLFIGIPGTSRTARGTGFFISPKCIVTTAHNLYLNLLDKSTNQLRRRWAEYVEVVPAYYNNYAPFSSQKSYNFRVPDEYQICVNRDFDYGAIILPDTTLYDKVKSYFNYALKYSEENLIFFGYPSYKPQKEKNQWEAIGLSKGYYSGCKRLLYNFDTEFGASGSPICIKKADDTYVVVGVHRGIKSLTECNGSGNTNCMKECILVNEGFREKWNEWKKL